jgi:hypothetical protein
MGLVADKTEAGKPEGAIKHSQKVQPADIIEEANTTLPPVDANCSYKTSQQNHDANIESKNKA